MQSSTKYMTTVHSMWPAGLKLDSDQRYIQAQ